MTVKHAVLCLAGKQKFTVANKVEEYQTASITIWSSKEIALQYVREQLAGTGSKIVFNVFPLTEVIQVSLAPPPIVQEFVTL